MAGRKPDFRVVFVEDNGKGRKTYFRVGAAWKNGGDSGTESVGIEINIGLPLVLAPHTKLVLFENKADDEDTSFDQT
jgi:uncharacterized protein (DUF736 family)